MWHGAVCVDRRLAVLVELRLVTDRHRPMASTADAQHRAVKTGKTKILHLFTSTLRAPLVTIYKHTNTLTLSPLYVTDCTCKVISCMH